MADETGYNGWTNYPTWAVNLWLSNDEPLYNETRERARQIMFNENNRKVRADWTVEEAARYYFADNLKEWVTDELAPDLGASFAADLLGWALGEVNWDEIATGWLEDLS